ncbi:MAG: hypothetical protein V4617_07770 [Gemmatimonadota bacterium]
MRLLPHALLRLVSGSGTNKSIWVPGSNTDAKSSVRGSTPTTVAGWLLSTTVGR